MTKAKYDTGTVLDTAMQIIQDEHVHSISDPIDNEEHVERIVRIAESAGKLLSATGIPKRDVEGNVQRIIQYGRRLFVEEWMQPQPGDTEVPREEDAIEEFDQYLEKSRRTKKQISSNQAL